MRTRFAVAAFATLAACAQPGTKQAEPGTPPTTPSAAAAAAGASVSTVPTVPSVPSTPSAPSAQQDAQFVRDIAYANLAEIEIGKVAVSRAQNPSVRRFGRRMIDDHMALLAEANQLALAKGMQPPTSPDPRHQSEMRELRSMSGETLDRAYMEQRVKDHTETLQLLQQASSQAGDPQLRALAQKAMPIVRQHLEMAQHLAGDIVGRAQ